MRIYFNRLKHFCLADADSCDEANRIDNECQSIMNAMKNDSRVILHFSVGISQIYVGPLYYSFFTVDSPQSNVFISESQKTFLKASAWYENSSKYVIIADLSENDAIIVDDIDDFSFKFIQSY